MLSGARTSVRCQNVATVLLLTGPVVLATSKRERLADLGAASQLTARRQSLQRQDHEERADRATQQAPDHGDTAARGQDDLQTGRHGGPRVENGERDTEACKHAEAALEVYDLVARVVDLVLVDLIPVRIEVHLHCCPVLFHLHRGLVLLLLVVVRPRSR